MKEKKTGERRKKMKKMKRFLVVLSSIIFLVLPTYSWGAGTVTQELSHLTNNFKSIVFTWVGDASDGSVPATESNWNIHGYICKVITNPGSTAPTTLYDITLTNSDGVDVVHGQLADRSATASEEIVPVPADNVTVYGCSPVVGTITLNITNNSVNSANGTVTVIFTKE